MVDVRHKLHRHRYGDVSGSVRRRAWSVTSVVGEVHIIQGIISARLRELAYIRSDNHSATKQPLRSDMFSLFFDFFPLTTENTTFHIK
jgi:hypothetical protein